MINYMGKQVLHKLFVKKYNILVDENNSTKNTSYINNNNNK